jgi:hypothetical protein
MSNIVTERSGSILRVQLNRPAEKNAMTSGMYNNLAGLLDDAIERASLHSADSEEAFTAFFEKRPPSFTRTQRATPLEKAS